MKFAVNNGQQRRCMVLLWGEQINVHEKKIVLNRVVRVEAALCKATSGNFNDNERNLIPFDLNVQSYSEIQTFQEFRDDDTSELVEEVIETYFSNITEHVGKVIRKNFVPYT